MATFMLDGYEAEVGVKCVSCGEIATCRCHHDAGPCGPCGRPLCDNCKAYMPKSGVMSFDHRHAPAKVLECAHEADYQEADDFDGLRTILWGPCKHCGAKVENVVYGHPDSWCDQNNWELPDDGYEPYPTEAPDQHYAGFEGFPGFEGLPTLFPSVYAAQESTEVSPGSQEPPQLPACEAGFVLCDSNDSNASHFTFDGKTWIEARLRDCGPSEDAIAWRKPSEADTKGGSE